MYTKEDLLLIQHNSPYYNSYLVANSDKNQDKKFECKIKKNFVKPIFRIFYDLIIKSDFDSEKLKKLLVAPPLDILQDEKESNNLEELKGQLEEAYKILFEEKYEDLFLYSGKNFSFLANLRIELGK